MAVSKSNPRQKPSGSWEYRYVADGKQHTLVRASYGEAVEAGLEAELQVRKGVWTDPAKAKITVHDGLTRWLAGKRDINTRTRARYQDGINHFKAEGLAGNVGRLEVGKLSPAAIRELVTLLEASMAASSVRNTLHPLRAMLRQAVSDGVLARNPWRDVSLPRAAGKEHVILTPKQIRKLGDAAPHTGDFITFLGHTGLRAWVEGSNVKVKDVRQDGGKWEVRVLGKGAKYRTVPLAPSIIPLVKNRMQGKTPDAWLFLTPTGGKLHASNFYRDVWEKAKKAAGVDPRMDVHDLRASFITWLVRETDIETAREIAGHEDIATTAGYCHASRESMRQAMDRYDGIEDEGEEMGKVVEL